jgi:uncharacterized integral membrane protein
MVSMRVRTLLSLGVALLLAVFVVLNWRVFAAPAHVSLAVTSVDAPLGLLMLALFALGLVVLSAYVGVWQATLLMEFRRQAKELQTQRTLAESAEASRFTELGSLIRTELALSDQRIATALDGLRRELEETENSLAATLAEMDDRYRRKLDAPVG